MSTLNPWHKGVVCALDFESTGVDATQARIVTACFLEIHPGGKIRERVWLVNPGVPIPPSATEIHGITDEQVQQDGRPTAEVLPQLMECLTACWQAGWPVVGHNLGGYDLTLLDHELHRHNLGSITDFGGPGLVVDTLCIDKALRRRVRGKGARTLQACADAYAITLDGAHDAKHDCVAAARIAWRMCEQFPDLVQVDLLDLQDRQKRMHRSWAEEFGAYLTSVGGVDDVVREWPYTPAVVAVSS